MKSLITIKNVYNVANVISLVLMIFCIIGSVACGIVAIVCAGLFIADKSSLLTEVLEKLDMGTFRVVMTEVTENAICAAISAVLFSKLRKYCKNGIELESPFSKEFAKQTFEMGIFSVVLWFIMAVISGVISAIGNTKIYDYGSFEISFGLFLMFLSAVYKYGAELKENNSNDINTTNIKTNEDGSSDLFGENVNDEPKDKIFL